MIYCGGCGGENIEGDRFCVGCGAALRPRTPTPADAHSAAEDPGATRLEPRSSTADFTPGSLLDSDRYRIDSVLGTGGMGTVYRATDLKLGQAVALKIIHGHLLEGTAGIERLRNEVRIARELQHPGIVRIYELGSDRGREFFTMELVEGPTLREFLEQRPDPLSLEEAKTVLLPLLEALAYAHRHTVHRDVKPENVLLVEGDLARPKLVDFGIAKTIEGETLTRTAMELGTPEYVAPEQTRDAANVDHRADLFSIGVMLYELVTGERPAGLFDLPSVLRPGLSADLDALVGQLLKPRPKDRPASARAVAAQLTALGQSPAATSVALKRPEQTQASSQWHRGKLALFSTLAVLLAGVIFFLQYQPPREQIQEAPTAKTTQAKPETVPRAPAAPVPVPAAPMAGLVVRSDTEGARVTIDGQDFGVPGSKRHELKPGTHSVRVEKKGYAPYETELLLGNNEVRTLHATLTPLLARLVVRSNVSGDRVTINGQSYGSSGTKRHEFKPGTYTVRVEKKGYEPYEEQVHLAAGAMHTVRAELARSTPPAPSGMVVIPAGKFYYGCNESVDSECDDDEKPGKRVTLPAFAIDKTEVTVAAYKACVRDGPCTDPKSGGSCNWEKSGRENHPVNCVDWNQAKTYCEWSDKRLPTEQEWEKAARGTGGQKYPWGNERASCARAVMDDGGNGCGRNSTWAVGSKPSGASPYGALDMAGNVWEWTSSWYSSKQKYRVLRGGSWYYVPRLVRASNRDGGDPSFRVEDLGFRCAQ